MTAFTNVHISCEHLKCWIWSVGFNLFHILKKCVTMLSLTLNPISHSDRLSLNGTNQSTCYGLSKSEPFPLATPSCIISIFDNVWLILNSFVSFILTNENRKILIKIKIFEKVWKPKGDNVSFKFVWLKLIEVKRLNTGQISKHIFKSHSNGYFFNEIVD